MEAQTLDPGPLWVSVSANGNELNVKQKKKRKTKPSGETCLRGHESAKITSCWIEPAKSWKIGVINYEIYNKTIMFNVYKHNYN